MNSRNLITIKPLLLAIFFLFGSLIKNVDAETMPNNQNSKVEHNKNSSGNLAELKLPVGNSEAVNSDIRSSQFRERASIQRTVLFETHLNRGKPFTNQKTGTRAVPVILKDDDGFSKENIKPVDRSTWTVNNCGKKICTCGLTQRTIAERILDCQTHPIIGPEATWDGAKQGNSGQGVWKLVARAGDKMGEGIASMGSEVWQDSKTGWLWSSRVSLALNWCKASGNNSIKNNPAADSDPSNVCNTDIYQNVGIGPKVKAISGCFEDDENFFTNKDPSIRSAGKAGLGLKSTPTVAWRLPTMDDYLLANVNGIRFVFPDMLQNGNWEWTAMIFSANRGVAWDYSSDYGGVGNDSRKGTNGVRCIGR